MLRETLEKLAAIEPTSLPFVSAYLDLTPELEGSYQSQGGPAETAPLRSWRRGAGEHRQFRPGLTRLRALISRKGKFFGPRGPERASFDADVKRIETYLEEGYDPACRGVAIFACSGAGFWEVVELPVPVQTRLIVDRMPVIHPLAYIDDAYDRYAICLADSQIARVYVVTLGQAEREERIKGPTINYKMTGGWSQKRIQERIANAVSEHIRDVAARLEEIVFAENLPWILLSGDEIVQTEFQRYLSDRARERVVEVNRLDTKLPEHEAVARSLEVVIAAEQAEAREVARRALEATLSDGLGAAGAEAVALALRQGAVDTLVLAADFRASGWRCVDDPSLVGEGGLPSACPVGTGSVEAADLREEFVSLATRTGAEVEFVEGSEELARMGGVAALLRWQPEELPNRVAEEEPGDR
jgi:peptide subunit release factor 1 (eRF1)